MIRFRFAGEVWSCFYSLEQVFKYGPGMLCQQLLPFCVGMHAVRQPRGGFFLQGLIVCLGNPKQLLFFGALLPQFLNPAGDHLSQIALLGGTAVFFAALSDGAYALAAGQIGRRLTAARIRLVTRLSGGMLIGGGLWLAFSRAR